MINTEEQIEFDDVLREIEVGVDISEGNYDILRYYRDEYKDLLAEVKRLRGIIDYIRDTGRMVKPKRYSGFFLSIMEKVLTTEEYLEWRNKE